MKGLIINYTFFVTIFFAVLPVYEHAQPAIYIMRYATNLSFM